MKAHAETIPVVVTGIEPVTPADQAVHAPLARRQRPSRLLRRLPHRRRHALGEGRTDRESVLTAEFALGPEPLSDRRPAARRRLRGGSRYLHDRIQVGDAAAIASARRSTCFPLAKLAPQAHPHRGRHRDHADDGTMVDGSEGRRTSPSRSTTRRATPTRLLRPAPAGILRGRVTLYFSSRGDGIDLAECCPGSRSGRTSTSAGPPGDRGALRAARPRAGRTATFTSSSSAPRRRGPVRRVPRRVGGVGPAVHVPRG